MAFLGFLSTLIPLLTVGLIVLVIAALVGGRGEADPTGRRPYAIYLSLVTFIGLFATLGALFALVKAISDKLLLDGSQECIGFDCPDFGTGSGSGLREILIAALIVAIAGAFTYLHGRKLLELRGLEMGSASAPGRVLNVFGYSVSFFGVFIVLAFAVAAATSLVDIVDEPFSGARDAGISTLLTALVMVVATGLVFRFAWSRFELGIGKAQPTSAAPDPTPPAPPAV